MCQLAIITYNSTHMYINILFCKFTKETSLRDHFCDLQLGNMYSVMSVGLLNSETWTKCGHVDSLCGLGLCFRDNKIGEGKIKKTKRKKRKCPLQNNNNNNNNNNEILMAVTINYWKTQ